MEYLQLLKEGGIDPAVVEPEDAIKVMTIHQAKGLEFPVVIIPSVMNGRLPSIRRSPHYDVPYEIRASGLPEVEDPHLVDERKLFYVGITRAKELLILGTANVINKRGGGPSQFLFEIFGEDLTPVKKYSDMFVKDVESVEPLHKEARDRLSFSKIAYFLQCPIRFKYIVVYGIKVLYETPVDFGANVHRALQEIHERSKLGNIPNDSEIESIVNNLWFSPLYAEPNIDKAAKLAAIIQLQRYVKNYKGSILKSDCTEVNFSFDLNQCPG